MTLLKGRQLIDKLRRPPKRLMTAAVAVLLLFCAAMIAGQYSISGLLAEAAISAAEEWRSVATRDAGPDSALVVQPTGSAAADIRAALGIDAVLLAGPNGELTPIGATPADAAQDFTGVTRSAASRVPSVTDLPPGAYTTDWVHWGARSAYRNWVVLPGDAGQAGRLALRVQQSDKQASLVRAFRTEVLYSGGVAAATFLAFMAGFAFRVRQLSAENAVIRHAALHDELTGLPNRKQLEEFMATTLESVRAGSHKAALFVLDLDGFKSVNDTLGHPVGDGLLKATAKRLKASLRAGDLLARLSGDEFVIVVPHLTDPAMLPQMAERILKMMSNPFRVDGHEIQVGCSIGIAVAPENGADSDRLMRNADFALYRAKSEGRRTWRFFDPKMAADQASRRTLEDGLRHALENHHFQIFYQPQVALGTGQTVGYEAVLRWRIPGKGLVPASVFVSIAEETGLVIPIGEWAIRQVARDCAILPADRKIAINLSATQLKRDGVEDFLLETLRQHDVELSRIEVEVNESIVGRNVETAFQRLGRMREGGISIVLDSFGVGSLNLGLLSRYSFDKVKVDRTFLLEDQQKGVAVLAAICSLGRSLGFRVSGQGVETSEHAQLLRMAGCDEGQGFYFAEPMPLESVLRADDGQQNIRLAASA